MQKNYTPEGILRPATEVEQQRGGQTAVAAGKRILPLRLFTKIWLPQKEQTWYSCAASQNNAIWRGAWIEDLPVCV
jgi:hypothetical protein